MAASASFRRLLRDWKELDMNPLETVSACPEENNMYTWHCNLRPLSGIYRGLVLHLKLFFPDAYPLQPPQLQLATSIPHPNVFSTNFVCLNMLRPPTTFAYSGWSNAYSAQSILLQLQSFLFAENIPQDYGEDLKQVTSLMEVTNTKRRIMQFKCDTCPHTHDNPYPALPEENCAKGIDEEMHLEYPIDTSKNVLNTCDMDPDLFVANSGLFISKKGMRGWRGIRATKGYRMGPSETGSIYFEAKIGRGDGVARIGYSIGGSDENGRSLGEDEFGWGYGGTGKKSHNNEFVDYGEGYASDDVVGAYLELKTGRIIFFKNGRSQGLAFVVPEKYTDGIKKIYPTISLRQSNVELNFGRRSWWNSPPFKYHRQVSETVLQEQQEQQRQQTQKKIEFQRQLQDQQEKLRVQNQHKKSEPMAQQKKNNNSRAKNQQQPKQPKIELKENASQKPVSHQQRQLQQQREKIALSGNLGNSIYDLPVELLLIIFSKQKSRDLLSLGKVCKRFASIVYCYGLHLRGDLVCYFTKENIDESILGVGIEVDYFGDKSINSIHTPLELLSLSAFEKSGVRTSVWNEKFSFFIPLILSPDHAKRAYPALRTCLERVYRKGKLSFPDLVLEVVPKIMNSMIVMLMSSENDHTKFYVESSISERALLGYCSFHHMLLYLSREHPEIQETINKKIAIFLESDQSKQGIPDLGDFLAYSSVSSYPWSKIGTTVLKEIFIRNSKWAIKKFPELARDGHVSGTADMTRLQNTWRACLTSWRLVMFQVYFLKNLAHPAGKTPDDVLTHYNRSYGQPNEVMKTRLHENCKTIANISYWPQFFDFLGVSKLSPVALTDLLVNSVKVSAQRKYHTT